jgi:taurine dioxygenase
MAAFPIVTTEKKRGLLSMSALQYSHSITDLGVTPLTARIGAHNDDVRLSGDLPEQRWQVGDVAIWDNTATQRCAVNDYGDQKRMVRRSTVTGEAPMSVGGRRSVRRGKIARPLEAQLPSAA